MNRAERRRVNRKEKESVINIKSKDINLEQGKEYELTIRATYYDSDDLVLSFVNELSDIIVSADDILNIEEVE